MGEPGSETPVRKGFPWRGLVLGCGGLLVLGAVGAAIIVPKFLHFGSRSKESEVKSNLHALFTAERSFWQETDRYSEDAVEVGYAVERGNRYTYFLGAGGAVARRDTVANPPMAKGTSVIGTDRARYTGSPAIDRFDQIGCPLTVPTLKDGTRAGRGITGTGSDAVFVGYGVGNIDTDPSLDCWSVATVDRVDAAGEKIPAGQPFCERSDVGR